jgi:hypothetical protein
MESTARHAIEVVDRKQLEKIAPSKAGARESARCSSGIVSLGRPRMPKSEEILRPTKRCNNFV